MCTKDLHEIVFSDTSSEEEPLTPSSVRSPRTDEEGVKDMEQEVPGVVDVLVEEGVDVGVVEEQPVCTPEVGVTYLH